MLLEELGAEVNVRFGALGDTPLHLAFEREDDAMVELLLLHGADYKALNKNLQTPIAFTDEHQRKRHNLLTQASHVLTLDVFNKQHPHRMRKAGISFENQILPKKEPANGRRSKTLTERDREV